MAEHLEMFRVRNNCWAFWIMRPLSAGAEEGANIGGTMFDETDEKAERGERGRWKKGTRSPNPGGYSKADRAARKDVKEAARKFTPQVLKMLMNIVENPKAPASARVQAGQTLLDRGWGKVPVQENEAPAQEIVVRWIGENVERHDPAGDRASRQR
jgi:hypothetical protein